MSDVGPAGDRSLVADRLSDRLPDRLSDHLSNRPFDDERTQMGAIGVLVAAIGLVALAGLPGVVAAVVLAAAWYLLTPVYAFAVGQVALVAFAPGGELVRVAVAEAGLFGTLLAPVTTLSDPGPPVTLTAAWALVGGALAWASAGVEISFELWLAGLVLVALTALAAYALHRYLLVSLGLVDDGDAPTDVDVGGGASNEQ